MYKDSRLDIYDYVYNLIYGVVTNNVYSMNEPQELTSSDTTDGFIVVRVGDFNDESEFKGQTYGWARVFVEAYIPPISRGRLDFGKYKEFEDGINDVISYAQTNGGNDSAYSIQEGSVLSMDGNAESNANNAYFMFIKSFVVIVDKEQE